MRVTTKGLRRGAAPWRRLGAAFCVAALALAVSGCGSSSDDGKGSGDDSSAPLTLSVALSSVSTAFSDVYLADSRGLFKKYNLTVDIQVKGATAAALTAAGQVDVCLYGTSAALAPISQGRELTVVYNTLGNVQGSVIASAKSNLKKLATTEDTIMSLSGRKVATLGTSGGAFGNAKTLSNYIVAHGGKPLEIQGPQTADLQRGLLVTGQVDAVISGTDAWSQVIKNGQASILVPATDPGQIKILGGEIVSAPIWGLKSTIKEKSAAVTAFIAALRDVHKYEASVSAEALGTELATIPAFKEAGITAEAATNSRDNGPLYAPKEGLIDEAVWKSTLKVIGDQGVEYDVNDAKFSFKNVVDMAYWNKATDLMKKAGSK